MPDPLAACASAIITVTAPLVMDGDTIRGTALRPDIRLTGEGDVPHDTPEVTRPGCDRERHLGHEAERFLRDLLRRHGGGAVCIIDHEGGGVGRDLGVLYVEDGTGSVDVMDKLRAAGLAKLSDNADWCE